MSWGVVDADKAKRELLLIWVVWVGELRVLATRSAACAGSGGCLQPARDVLPIIKVLL